MIEPTPKKPLDEWSFAELVTWASWQVVEGMVANRGLHSTMFSVCQSIVGWGRLQETWQGKRIT